jgi:G:T-mismatch repair DNA endonuclease (very short patch repair protein)
MGKIWTKEELDLIKDLYESGLNAEDTFKKFSEQFIERTLAAISLVIKRKKFKHTIEQTRLLKQAATKGKNNGMYGKPGPNKGLTKKTSERICNASKKISETRKDLFAKGLLDVSGDKNGMYGKAPWNFGLTSETSDVVKGIGEKLSIIQKDRWHNLSIDEQNLIIGRMTKAANLVKKNSSIEVKIENFLLEEKIAFIKQHRKSKFVFDFFIEKANLVIECQGDYWHANPAKYDILKLNKVQEKNVERDIRKKQYLKENSINSLFFWECEIHKNFNYVKETIIKANAHGYMECNETT